MKNLVLLASTPHLIPGYYHYRTVIQNYKKMKYFFLCFYVITYMTICIARHNGCTIKCNLYTIYNEIYCIVHTKNI